MFRTVKNVSSEKSVLLTVDVEDWFQVENFKQWIPFSSWSSRKLRVEKNTHRILDLFDGVSESGSWGGGRIKATFFVLGWVAERVPGLVREIQSRGHEIASHGYSHRLCNLQSLKELKGDISLSKNLLEEITGMEVAGYRAPSFSIDDRVLQVVQESGFKYDSSFNSFAVNSRYGRVDFSGCSRKGIAFEISQDFYEIPVTNLDFGDRSLPMGGGGYFRLFPLPLFRRGVEMILRKQDAYLFYLHPWEVDPDQPRVGQASPLARFRHYINLGKTCSRLISLIDHLSRCSFIPCREYIGVRG